jgi:hypothetical protein
VQEEDGSCLTYRFANGIEEIRQCWYDEIAALDVFLLHLCRAFPIIFGDWQVKTMSRLVSTFAVSQKKVL